MLQNPPSSELLRHELRRRVCEHCRWRPTHSEALGPEAVRACELTCPVFVHLGQLRRVALLADPMLGSKADILRHRIHQLYRTYNGDLKPPASLDSSPADFHNPLNCYRAEIINAILDVIGRN